jgi:hypothetical protein
MIWIKKTTFDLANTVYMRVCVAGKMKTDADFYVCTYLDICHHKVL